MKKYFLLIVFLILLLTGCGSKTKLKVEDVTGKWLYFKKLSNDIYDKIELNIFDDMTYQMHFCSFSASTGWGECTRLDVYYEGSYSLDSDSIQLIHSKHNYVISELDVPNIRLNYNTDSKFKLISGDYSFEQLDEPIEKVDIDSFKNKEEQMKDIVNNLDPIIKNNMQTVSDSIVSELERIINKKDYKFSLSDIEYDDIYKSINFIYYEYDDNKNYTVSLEFVFKISENYKLYKIQLKGGCIKNGSKCYLTNEHSYTTEYGLTKNTLIFSNYLKITDDDRKSFSECMLGVKTTICPGSTVTIWSFDESVSGPEFNIVIK